MGIIFGFWLLVAAQPYLNGNIIVAVLVLRSCTQILLFYLSRWSKEIVQCNVIVRVFGPYWVIQVIMEAPKLKKK